jgi:hypothetical protein
MSDDALSALYEAWPDADWTSERIDSWRSTLAGKPPDLAVSVIEGLALSHEDVPSTVEFVAAYQAAARKALEPEAAEPSDPGGNGEFLAGMRAVFGLPRPEHDHRHGVSSCPMCSRHDSEAHKRDRYATVPSCPRCRELGDLFMERVL